MPYVSPIKILYLIYTKKESSDKKTLFCGWNVGFEPTKLCTKKLKL